MRYFFLSYLLLLLVGSCKKDNKLFVLRDDTGIKFENTLDKDSTTTQRLLIPNNGPISSSMSNTPIQDMTLSLIHNS